ncbi:hypothetical protein [Methanobrevibacter arboriphilus]|nr:hypothetical protein [Methanobrevibacter arboriphilus]
MSGILGSIGGIAELFNDKDINKKRKKFLKKDKDPKIDRIMKKS